MKRNRAENCHSEVESHMTREGMTMTKAMELADVLGWDPVWAKRWEVR